MIRIRTTNKKRRGIVATKGGDARISSPETIAEYLGKMKALADVSTDKLGTSDYQIFDKLRRHIAVLVRTDHAEYESFYYRQIQPRFDDGSKMTPGTVGSFFGGASVVTPFEGELSSCSLYSAGSIPHPKEVDKACDKLVCYGKWNKTLKAYDTKIMNRSVENTKDCIFFVDSDSYDVGAGAFKGFSHEEKAALSGSGVENVYLFGYDENDCRKISKLLPDSVPLDELKLRGSQSADPRIRGITTVIRELVPSMKKGSGLWMLLLVLIVAVALLFLWRNKSRMRY